MLPNNFDLMSSLRPSGMLAATAGGCSAFPRCVPADYLPLSHSLVMEVKEDPFASACEVQWLTGGISFLSTDYLYAVDRAGWAGCVEPEQNHGPHIPRRPQDPHARRPPERYSMMTI